MGTIQAYIGWWSRWRKRRASAATPRTPSSVGSEALVSTPVLIGRHVWVWGLDWQVFLERQEYGQLMRASHIKGYSHYVVNVAQDMVGFASGLSSGPGKKTMSAAIHLSETQALGGLELFVFELPSGLISVVGLIDSQPVPHFDAVGTEQDMMSLVAEFRTLHANRSIRYVGNQDLFENIEKMMFNEVFSSTESAALLVKLPNYRLRKLLAFTLVPAILIGASVFWGIHLLNEKQQAERLAREQDRNFIYEGTVDAAMQQAGLKAPIVLDRWRQIVFRTPTAQAGWILERVDCKVNECTFVWGRDFGSYQDFHALVRDEFTRSTETQTGESPSKASIASVLRVDAPPNSALGLTRANLQPVRQVLVELGSRLQDISLLPDAVVKLKQPELYPNTGAQIGQIQNPVVRGDWSITHELWTLGDLIFDQPYLVLQSLSIQQDEKSKNWIYTLTGHYYAKGRN